MIFTIQTCNYIQGHFHLASFHTCHGYAEINGARDSPADSSNATLADANHHKTQQKKRAKLTKLRSNFQTRQSWSNMNQDSLTALSISRLKCVKHILVYCLAVIWENLWHGCHVENRRAKTKHRSTRSMLPTCQVYRRNPLRSLPCNITTFIHNTAVPTFSQKYY